MVVDGEAEIEDEGVALSTDVEEHVTDARVDGRFLEIDGRRWRASDPSIPAPFRSELVHELMDARRAVGAGKRADDEDAVAAARARVQDAKVALGERGTPWWETPTDEVRADRIRATILALLRHRAPTSTICPSDAARATCGVDWRDHMDAARRVAFELQDAGVVEVRHAGERVSCSEDAHGPLRIARGPRWV